MSYNDQMIENFNVKLKEYVDIITKIKTELQGKYDQFKKKYKTDEELFNAFENNVKDDLLSQLNTINHFGIDAITSFEDDLKGTYTENYELDPIYAEIKKELDAFIESDYNNLDELSQHAIEVTLLDTISGPITDDTSILKKEYDFLQTKKYIRIPKTQNIRCINFGISFSQFNLSHFQDNLIKNDDDQLLYLKNVNFENNENIINRYYRGDIFILDAKKEKPYAKAFFMIPDNESLGSMKCGPEFTFKLYVDEKYIYLLPILFRPYRLDWKETQYGSDVDIFDMYNTEKVIDPKVLFYCHMYAKDLTTHELVGNDENIETVDAIIKKSTEITGGEFEIKPLKEGFYKYYNFLIDSRSDTEIVDNAPQKFKFYTHSSGPIQYEKTALRDKTDVSQLLYKNFYYMSGQNINYYLADTLVNNNLQRFMNFNLQNKFLCVDNDVYIPEYDIPQNKLYITQINLFKTDKSNKVRRFTLDNTSLYFLKKTNDNTLYIAHGTDKFGDIDKKGSVFIHELPNINNNTITYDDMKNLGMKHVMVDLNDTFGGTYLKKKDMFLLITKQGLIIYSRDFASYRKQIYTFNQDVAHTSYNTEIILRLNFCDYINDKLVILINDVLLEYNEDTDEVVTYYVRSDNAVNRSLITEYNMHQTRNRVDSVFYSNGRYYIAVERIGIFEVIKSGKYKLYEGLKETYQYFIIINDPHHKDKLIIINRSLERNNPSNDNNGYVYTTTVYFNATLKNVLKASDNKVYCKPTAFKFETDIVVKNTLIPTRQYPYFTYNINAEQNKLTILNDITILSIDLMERYQIKSLPSIKSEISNIFREEGIKRLRTDIIDDPTANSRSRRIPYTLKAYVTGVFNQPLNYDYYNEHNIKELIPYVYTENGYYQVMEKQNSVLNNYDFNIKTTSLGTFFTSKNDNTNVYFIPNNDTIPNTHFSSNGDIQYIDPKYIDTDIFSCVKLYIPQGVKHIISHYRHDTSEKAHVLFYGNDGDLYGIFSYERYDKYVFEVSKILLKNEKELSHLNIDYCIDKYLIDFQTKRLYEFDEVISGKYYFKLTENHESVFDTIIQERITLFNNLYYSDSITKITSYEDFYIDELNNLKLFIDKDLTRYFVSFIDNKIVLKTFENNTVIVKEIVHEKPIKSIVTSYYALFIEDTDDQLFMYGYICGLHGNMVYTDTLIHCNETGGLLATQKIHDVFMCDTRTAVLVDKTDTIKGLYISSGLNDIQCINDTETFVKKMVITYNGPENHNYEVPLYYLKEYIPQTTLNEYDITDIKDIVMTEYATVISYKTATDFSISFYDPDKTYILDEINAIKRFIRVNTLYIYIKSFVVGDSIVVLYKNPILLNNYHIIIAGPKSDETFFGPLEHYVDLGIIKKSRSLDSSLNGPPSYTFVDIQRVHEGSLLFYGMEGVASAFEIYGVGNNEYNMLGLAGGGKKNDYTRLQLEYNQYELTPTYVCYNETSTIIPLKKAGIDEYVLLFMGKNIHNTFFGLQKDFNSENPIVLDKIFTSPVRAFYTKDAFVYFNENTFTCISYEDGLETKSIPIYGVNMDTMIYNKKQNKIYIHTNTHYMLEYDIKRNTIYTIASNIEKFHFSEKYELLKVCDDKKRVGTFYFGNKTSSSKEWNRCGLGIYTETLVNEFGDDNFVNPFKETKSYTYIHADHGFPYNINFKDTDINATIETRNNTFSYTSCMYSPHLERNNTMGIHSSNTYDMSMQTGVHMIRMINNEKNAIMKDLCENITIPHLQTKVDYVELEILPHEVIEESMFDAYIALNK